MERRSLESLHGLRGKLEHQMESIKGILHLYEDTEEGDLRKYRQHIAGEFLKADRDYDGLLSQQEFFAYVNNAFNTLEIDHISDQKLTERYKVIDINGDGVLEFDELAPVWHELLKYYTYKINAKLTIVRAQIEEELNELAIEEVKKAKTAKEDAKKARIEAKEKLEKLEKLEELQELQEKVSASISVE